MATTTGARAASTFPAGTGGPSRLLVAYGSYDFAVNPTIADVINLCKLPPNAVVLGGFLRGEDLDTNVSPTIDIDIGTAADPDQFGNFGVSNGSAVTNYLAEGGFLLPLNGTLKDGPVALSTTQETIIQAVVNAAAATFAAGTITVVIHYVCP